MAVFVLCHRNLDIAVQGLDNAGLELKLSDVLGDLELGQLTEEYYEDAELRKILSNAALNPDQMASLEGHHLLLVTSVVYSTKFVLQGSRMHQVLWVTPASFTLCRSFIFLVRSSNSSSKIWTESKLIVAKMTVYVRR